MPCMSGIVPAAGPASSRRWRATGAEVGQPRPRSGWPAHAIPQRAEPWGEEPVELFADVEERVDVAGSPTRCSGRLDQGPPQGGAV